MIISRRQALMGGLLGSVAGCASTLPKGSFTARPAIGAGAFAHGVASGDPAGDSVVLWTRLTTTETMIGVVAEIAEDAGFARVVRRYPAEASASRDHTVKIIADGLTPGGRYFYRFTAGDQVSPIGRTRTLPAKTDRARFAVASCSNYPFGYFNAYDHIARDTDIDAVIHLGDYIYEYGREGYGGKTGLSLGRAHEPAHEILTLADYRLRHAQYKSDAGAQAMHAAHPFIAIWDDHETANNAWERGAENHTEGTEGDWETRRNAALQAYYEWMPVRDPEPGRPREALYKAYSWGGLMTLTAIETRLTARGKQLEYDEIVPGLKTPEDIARFRREVLADPSRQMLGDAQLDYLAAALKASVGRAEPWRVIANQVIMARVTAPNLANYTDEASIVALEKEWSQARAFVEFTKLGLPLNLDAWDGYPIARERFYAMAKAAGARDLIVLTGDTHEAWGNDLYDDAGTRMGVELGATGVSSPAPTQYLADKAFDYSLLLRRENRDVRYHDPMFNGYFTLTLEGDRGHVDFWGLSTVLSQDYDAEVTAAFDLERRGGTVEFGGARGLGVKERVVFRP